MDRRRLHTPLRQRQAVACLHHRVAPAEPLAPNPSLKQGLLTPKRANCSAVLVCCGRRAVRNSSIPWNLRKRVRTGQTAAGGTHRKRLKQSMNSAPIALRLASGSVTPFSRAIIEARASTLVTGRCSCSANVAITRAPSSSRSSPLSTNTQCSRSPITCTPSRRHALGYATCQPTSVRTGKAPVWEPSRAVVAPHGRVPPPAWSSRWRCRQGQRGMHACSSEAPATAARLPVHRNVRRAEARIIRGDSPLQVHVPYSNTGAMLVVAAEVPCGRACMAQALCILTRRCMRAEAAAGAPGGRWSRRRSSRRHRRARR